MPKCPSLRHRLDFRRLAPVLVFLAAPATARADLLVHELNDRYAVTCVATPAAGQLEPLVSVSACDGNYFRAARKTHATNFLALAAVCVLPPINPGSGNSDGGTSGSNPPPPTTISGGGGGSGGGGSTPPPVTIASVSPEPGSLVIALVGMGTAGLAGFVRRKREARVA